MTREEIIKRLEATGREVEASPAPNFILMKSVKAEEAGGIVLDSNGAIYFIDDGYYWLCGTVENFQKMLENELE